MRKNYEESIEELRSLGVISPDEQLVIPDRMPQYDDEAPCGLSFFRTLIDESNNFSNLTIPRTFINKSECKNLSLKNTDAHESNFTWNDFLNVDFSEGTFDACDLRSSNYTNCNFSLASLIGADMRHANFENCSFDKAIMNRAIVSRSQLSLIHLLSPEQNALIDLRDDNSLEPNGG